MAHPTDEIAEMNESRSLRWRAQFGWVWAVTGLLGVAPSAAVAAAAAAPESTYRSAQVAPAAWQAFAAQLQGKLQERLAAEDDLPQRLQEALAGQSGVANAQGAALTVFAWILPNGMIDRVEFEQIDPVVAARLRVLLSTANVGPPPDDMLQPVHVRLLLRPKDQSGQGQ